MNYSCRIKVLASIIGNSVKAEAVSATVSTAIIKISHCFVGNGKVLYSYYIFHIIALYKPGDRPLFERITTLRKLGGYTANT